MMQAILDGDHDADFNNIRNAIKIRQTSIGRGVNLGDNVTLTNISPKYLDGVTGTVTSKSRETIGVRINDWHDTGRYSKNIKARPAQIKPS